jgi:signal transduction histidine kinase
MGTDGEKLKAVVQNLISNAIKFTEKGRVTVNVRHLPEADMFAQGNGYRNRNSQRQGSIHFRYEQVDSSATRRYGGVGPGLYIVKKFTDIGLMSKAS